jgi:hypothetical protein
VKVQDAIRKSDCGAARRPGRKGGVIVAMAVKGTLRLVASLENPSVTALLKKCDLDSRDWTPVKEKAN